MKCDDCGRTVKEPDEYQSWECSKVDCPQRPRAVSEYRPHTVWVKLAEEPRPEE